MEVNFPRVEQNFEESRPLTGDAPPRLTVPSVSRHGDKSSFESFAIFRDANFFDINSERYCKKGTLFQGPKRFLRLCLFGLLVPVLLISIPLYLRLVLYPPTNTAIAPTDQRLINGRTSSFWCQGQTVEMNGSFNAFLLDEHPKIRRELSVHTMRKHIILKDDYKEYWGFFLQRGSIVSIDLCNRYDGGSLMIIRGTKNLRKCAWIGEKDSAELDEDYDESSNEFHHNMDVSTNYSSGLTVEGADVDLTLHSKAKPEEKKKINSKERKDELDYFIKRIYSLGKDSKEIDEHLRMHKISFKRFNSRVSKLPDENLNKLHNHEGNARSRNISKNELTERFKRQLASNVENSAAEEIDSIDIENVDEDDSTVEYNSSEARELYKKIFHTPQGLLLERGTFFQRENNDSSNEEQRSSFSSSEEALLKCDGLLGAIPLFADSGCVGPSSPPSNKVTYKIPLTGTYYFVFYSDNEVFDSNMYFNMTLQRVVFNTDHPKTKCLNQTSCSLSFSFWSHDQAVVEVPEGDWDAAFIISSKCEPRVSIYLIIIILVPIFILCSAFS